MSDEQVTFEDLLIDEEEVSETLLTETLIDYIRIGDESGSIVPQEQFEDLTNNEKVTVVLLAQHALEGLDMTDAEWLTPTDIAKRSGVKKGSVYPAVRDLDDAGIVQNDDGSYRIPTHNLETAKQYIQQENDV
ncbi:hypothetical protein GOC83_18845 [Haloarcula rubripromontorii]|uniref:Transcription regulator TrmB N-terminal domain-containing protein n=1 Tax=Haloarcula rubripromontorii TaxID=1705562 RepID=A0A847UAD6_9EURY|nr:MULTISPECIES: TrmB family transcriptional regulator [Haloarcula]NLV08184.1 hypothetical protein [Haloarcula rubripromontorii]